MDMEYKIEKGIPNTVRNNKDIVELIDSLEVGDSFLATMSVINHLRMFVKRNKLPHKFSGKDTEAGYRIWLKSK